MNNTRGRYFQVFANWASVFLRIPCWTQNLDETHTCHHGDYLLPPPVEKSSTPREFFFFFFPLFFVVLLVSARCTPPPPPPPPPPCSAVLSAPFDDDDNSVRRLSLFAERTTTASPSLLNANPVRDFSKVSNHLGSFRLRRHASDARKECFAEAPKDSTSADGAPCPQTEEL